MDKPLPPPKKAATELKKLSPRIIKSWHDKFGEEYNLLDLGFNYLKNCKKVIKKKLIFKNECIFQRLIIIG